jgi:hypothetical protein
VERANSLKQKVSGLITKREDVEDVNSTDNGVMPDMEITKTMRATIQAAAMKAKLLFDSYHWTWADNNVPPSVKEIVDVYLEMVDEVWEQAMAVEDGETVGKGNVMKGRLTCEYVDEQWTFGIELASTIDGDEEESEEETDDNGLPKRVLANHKQLDA